MKDSDLGHSTNVTSPWMPPAGELLSCDAGTEKQMTRAGFLNCQDVAQSSGRPRWLHAGWSAREETAALRGITSSVELSTGQLMHVRN